MGWGRGGVFSFRGLGLVSKINFVEGGIQRIFVFIFILDCWLWEGEKGY